jgi:hypothetical protein
MFRGDRHWCTFVRGFAWVTQLHTSTLMVARRAKIAGAINLITLVALLTSIVLAFGAISRWSHRSEVLTRWPVAEATIRFCGIHRDYPFRRNGGGVSSWIVCQVEYSVDGVPHVARVDSTMRHAGDSGTYITIRNGWFVTVRPEAVFKGWIASHRPGSRLALRYAPSHPDAPTFVGVDNVVDVDPVPGSFGGVVVFGALAILGWFVSARLTRPDVASV